MSTTDQHIAVMLYLNLVQQFHMPPYTMSNLYTTYWANQAQIDGIFINGALLAQILSQLGPDVGNVIVSDKQGEWLP